MPHSFSYFITKQKKSSFWIYLASQGVSNMGDTFQYLSTIMLLYKITGSGLSAGFGLIASPIPSIILSPIAGVIGDIFNSKYLISLLNLMRGVIIIFFINSNNKFGIFVLIFILSILNVLSNPPAKKIVVSILNEDEILLGNSVMTGVSGLINLFGPIIAGALIDICGINFTLKVGIILFFLSGIITLFIKLDKDTGILTKTNNNVNWTYFEDFKLGFNYFINNTKVREIIAIGLVVSFTNAAINFAFYPFSLEVLNVTSKGFGFMISIFYGSNICAMGILILLNKRIAKSSRIYFFIPLFIVSYTWLVYGLTRNLGLIFLVQVIEGTSASFFFTLFMTKLQMSTQKFFLARIVGINDLIGNLGKISGIVCAYLIIKIYSIGILFEVFSFILFSYSIFKLLDFKPLALKNYRRIETKKNLRNRNDAI